MAYAVVLLTAILAEIGILTLSNSGINYQKKAQAATLFDLQIHNTGTLSVDCYKEVSGGGWGCGSNNSGALCLVTKVAKYRLKLQCNAGQTWTDYATINH